MHVYMVYIHMYFLYIDIYTYICMITYICMSTYVLIHLHIYIFILKRILCVAGIVAGVKQKRNAMFVDYMNRTGEAVVLHNKEKWLSDVKVHALNMCECMYGRIYTYMHAYTLAL